ncbi:MAG: FIST C-terminal domain-containing protein [Candidatus Obscuribacterales bacterium]|jgi:small ligand-binding sensory domain FIST|nr:FIST C-terminal domain-containing protein [Candidatus Obscuribacterales bacterium]
MKWASAIARQRSGKQTLEELFEAAAEQIKEQLGNSPCDLLFCFISPDFVGESEKVAGLAEKTLNAKKLVGCTAGGIIGGGIELEQVAAISLSAAFLPDVKIEMFHVEDDELPDMDAPPQKWEELVHSNSAEMPDFVLLPDPFSFRIEALVQGLDYAFPAATKVGGLASGAHQPGKNRLYLNENVFKTGAVGLALSGNIVVETIVAQGCRPVGRTFRVSKCQNNVLLELDGKPAVQALYEVLEGMSPKDQQLAKYSLFLGVVMDEFKEDFRPGDFLIRNILGLEPSSGALLVGELLRNERTIQFHLRDADTSSDDLRHLLKQYKEEHEGMPEGALLFSCLGRGEHLYGTANHDSDCFKTYLGEIPLSGFFCNGEIGPVAGTTFLHGYTSSFGLFRTKSNGSQE